MHPTATPKRRLLWGLVLTAGIAGLVHAQPPGLPAFPVAAQPAAQPGAQPDPKAEQPKDRDTGVADVKIDPRTNALIIPVGGFVRFDGKLPDIPADILVTREDYVQVRTDPNNPKVLLLTGRAPGLAQITLLFKDRPRQTFDVIVQPDFELLRRIIRQTAPTANVEVTPGLGNTLILSGYVTTPQEADTIFRLAISQVGGTTNNVINMLQIGGVQQVQIDVVIASVNRTELRARGFDFAYRDNTRAFNSLVSGLLTPPTAAGGIPTFNQAANLQFGVVRGASSFFAALQALRGEGLVKFLSEPRIVTQSGRPAQFLSGGQTPTIGPTSGITGPGVTYERVGIQVDVLPIVTGNGQIFLEINPSNRALGAIVNLGNLGNVPSFVEQRAQVSVSLENGQTVAIGGLIQKSTSASTNRVPVLGDLPYIGTAFSSITHTETESELVILVTPRLIGAMDCNQLPRRLPGQETRSPDDYELFLEGILEAPRGQRKVWNGRCYNAAWKCDPTANRFPCVGNVCYGPNGTMLPGGSCGPAGCATALSSGHAIRVVPAPTAAPVATAPMTVAVPVQAATPVTPVSAPAETPQPMTVSMPLAPAFPASEPATYPAVPGAPVETTPVEPAVIPAAPTDPGR